MKKLSIFGLSFMTLLPLLSVASPVDLYNLNFMKRFCSNQEFLGNPAAKRPHLHCGASFITYKKANGEHTQISAIGNCERTNVVFDDVKAKSNAFADYPALYNALVSYHQAGCPNQ